MFSSRFFPHGLGFARQWFPVPRSMVSYLTRKLTTACEVARDCLHSLPGTFVSRGNAKPRPSPSNVPLSVNGYFYNLWPTLPQSSRSGLRNLHQPSPLRSCPVSVIDRCPTQLLNLGIDNPHKPNTSTSRCPSCLRRLVESPLLAPNSSSLLASSMPRRRLSSISMPLLPTLE